LLRAHAAPPSELLDDHRPLEDELFTLLAAEGDRPAAELVEAVEGLDQVAEEGVAPELAVGDHVEPGRLLELHGLVHRAVLDALEVARPQLAGGQILARLHQVGRAEQAADRIAPNE